MAKRKRFAPNRPPGLPSWLDKVWDDFEWSARENRRAVKAERAAWLRKVNQKWTEQDAIIKADAKRLRQERIAECIRQNHIDRVELAVMAFEEKYLATEKADREECQRVFGAEAERLRNQMQAEL